MRLDDASEYWCATKWQRMHDLLVRFKIKPLVAVIPKNEDDKLRTFGFDEEYEKKVKLWIKNDGWIPALHGYKHIRRKAKGGLNPVNPKSEFVGLDLKLQEYMIECGLDILSKIGIFPKFFIAPCHTYDRNTLQALKNVSDIRIICDTVADDVYKKDDFFYIPQQCGMARKLNFSLTTFCYHPNFTTDEQFEKLEKFLEIHHDEFVSCENIEMKNRRRTFKEWILQIAYIVGLRIVRIAHKM